MAEFTLKTHIAAPREKVFEAATNLRDAPGRIKGITKMEVLTEGPIGVGTRFRETRMMFKREATEEMEITAFDPPNAYAIGCDSCGCRYHSEFRFTDNNSGTDVELSFQMKPLTFLAKVMGILLRPMMKMVSKCMVKDLQDLKESIESAPIGVPAEVRML
jgi:hypothetical protein